jgi:hypothetical protein
MMGLLSKTALSLAAMIIIVSLSQGIRAEMTEKSVTLPKTMSVWTRPDSVRIIDSRNIFQYMNGAGELYLSYGFDHLEVYEYTAADSQDGLLVEVYVMNTANDAFGLLSMDWGGEPVTIHASPSFKTDSTVAPPTRALYGGGLLRLCADKIYARVMAYRETMDAKEAVLSLGRKIAADRKLPEEPELLKILPRTVNSSWKLRRDRIGYFRSHLVLNSLYYLSHQNILNLDHSTEAVTATYQNILDAGTSRSVQLLSIKYATPEKAQNALDDFHNAYLHEHPKGVVPSATETHAEFFRIEDGWLGYALNGAYLGIVFECPNRESAQSMLNQIAHNAMNKENGHGK